MQKKNIYIIGRVSGSYRSQNIIKYFFDRGNRLYYNGLINEKFSKKSHIEHFFRLICRFFEIYFIQAINKVYNILISDVVFFLPHNNEIIYQLELSLAKLLRKRIYVDFYISIYDSIILDNEFYSKQSYKARKLKNEDLNRVKKANKVFFLNSNEAKYYMSILGLREDTNKKIILPLCVEKKDFFCDKPFFNPKLGNENKVFNICWWGTYIPLHGLENIIKGFQFLIERKPEIEFRLFLFGNNETKSEPYKKLINGLGIDNIIIRNDFTFSNGKLQYFLKSKCDLVLGNFGNSDKAKNVLVNKIIDGVVMKCPVLTGESKAPYEFFNFDTIFYSNNDPKSISDKIIEISQMNNDSILHRVNKAYDIYENSFSINALYSALDKINF